MFPTPAKGNPGWMTCQHQWDLPFVWEEVAFQLCSSRLQPCCTHIHASLTQGFSNSGPCLYFCWSQAYVLVSGRLGPPRAIECETERELLQSFRLKGRQSNKHCKHKLWQPFKTWKWKLENYFKHTGNYEPHTLCGSAFINISDRPDVHQHGKENPAGCRVLPRQMHISRVIGCLGHQLLMKPWEMYSRTPKGDIWTSLTLPSKR